MHYYMSVKEFYTAYIGSEDAITGDDTAIEITEEEYRQFISEINEDERQEEPD